MTGPAASSIRARQVAAGAGHAPPRAAAAAPPRRPGPAVHRVGNVRPAAGQVTVPRAASPEVIQGLCSCGCGRGEPAAGLPAGGLAGALSSRRRCTSSHLAAKAASGPPLAKRMSARGTLSSRAARLQAGSACRRRLALTFRDGHGKYAVNPSPAAVTKPAFSQAEPAVHVRQRAGLIICRSRATGRARNE